MAFYFNTRLQLYWTIKTSSCLREWEIPFDLEVTFYPYITVVTLSLLHLDPVKGKIFPARVIALLGMIGEDIVISNFQIFSPKDRYEAIIGRLAQDFRGSLYLGEFTSLSHMLTNSYLEEVHSLISEETIEVYFSSLVDKLLEFEFPHFNDIWIDNLSDGRALVAMQKDLPFYLAKTTSENIRVYCKLKKGQLEQTSETLPVIGFTDTGFYVLEGKYLGYRCVFSREGNDTLLPRKFLTLSDNSYIERPFEGMLRGQVLAVPLYDIVDISSNSDDRRVKITSYPIDVTNRFLSTIEDIG